MMRPGHLGPCCSVGICPFALLNCAEGNHFKEFWIFLNCVIVLTDIGSFALHDLNILLVAFAMIGMLPSYEFLPCHTVRPLSPNLVRSGEL